MQNVSQIIKRHNKRVTKTNERSTASFNCRDKNNCPINGSCRLKMLYVPPPQSSSGSVVNFEQVNTSWVHGQF